jgi:DNA-binding response OmpR family regulator
MKAKTILIIDDDEKVLEAIKDVLETESYVVNTAGNGISGIRSFDSDPPDLVITDINMPEVEGIELIRNLAKRNRKVPVIAVSGDPVGKKFLKAARLLGAVDTLLKPFSIAELRDKVSSALGGRKQTPPENGAT